MIWTQSAVSGIPTPRCATRSSPVNRPAHDTRSKALTAYLAVELIVCRYPLFDVPVTFTSPI
ncbi:hypothetical protein [Peribacillus butanolivorans]|uniref:hypothetical protein n=1 Tax=Peribacillus butanolivorans TaxID=421767 RepID=UPI0035E31C69